MLDTSAEFLTASDSNPRKCRAKLEFVWTDLTLDPSIVVSANEENRASNIDQVADGIEVIERKWAHLDGVIKADGTYNPMPSASTTTYDHVGWYGSTRCDSSGTFAVNPILTLTFDARAVVSLLVVGDSTYEEYPVDFDIALYSGESGTVLEHTEVVTGNDLLVWTKSITSLGLSNITKMTLEIKEWSTPDRIVKISEFYTAFLQTIDNDDIVKIDLLEERVISDGSLPVGNISANEVDITLQNIKVNYDGTDYVDPFFPANPNTIFAEMLLPNRKVIPYLGFVLADDSIEYVKLGTFWTGDWDIEEQSATCSVSARDRMDRLRLAEYKGSILYKDTNLYDLMNTVLNHAKDNIPMLDLVWQIDTELQEYEIPYAWFPKKSYFNTIKDIVEACMGQAYMNRDDILIVEGPSALIEEEESS